MRHRLLIPALLLVLVPLVRGDDATPEIVDRMKADLQYLTSDECEGRGPGTKGIDLAADRVAKVFKEAGLKPAGKDGSYFQPFEVRGSARVGALTAVTMTGPEASVSPKLRTGFYVIGQGGEGHVKRDLVFVGHGITAPEQSYDDYAGLDVSGKIVLMLRRTPRYANKEKPFASQDELPKLSALTAKLANAEKHKAAAVIMVNDAASAEETSDDISTFAGLAGSGAVKIPAVFVKRNLVTGLIRQAYGKTLAELEEQIEKDLKPVGKILKDCTADVEVIVEKAKGTDVKNVVGVLEGAGPLANETIVIGAHYDHLGYGGSGSLAGRNTNAIHHGADDNASGTTAVMELARRFGTLRGREGRRIVFMAFSAEELGLLGSAHYCKEPLFPLETTVAMLNLDMVGRLQPDKETSYNKIEIGGTGTAKQFDPMIDRVNEKYKFKIRKSASGMGPSDHQSFYMKNMPVLFFFTGLHTDYHRPSDTWDKVNIEGINSVTGMVEDLAKELAAADSKPEFVKVASAPTLSIYDGSTQRSTGPRLGVMPDYNDEKEEGVLLQGVSPGGAAEKAGVKQGDRIVTVAGTPIKNITGYMSAMSKLKAGEPVDIVVLRGKEKITVKVTPK